MMDCAAQIWSALGRGQPLLTSLVSLLFLPPPPFASLRFTRVVYDVSYVLRYNHLVLNISYVLKTVKKLQLPIHKRKKNFSHSLAIRTLSPGL